MKQKKTVAKKMVVEFKNGDLNPMVESVQKDMISLPCDFVASGVL